MSFAVKPWYNKVGTGTPLDAPSLATQTPLDATALRDLEARLSDYSDVSGGGVLVWDADEGAYVVSASVREFRGPVDPSTIPGITLAYGDVWTPTAEPTT